MLNLTDGLHDRCLSVLLPDSPKKLPILFDFHGAGGNAANYGRNTDVSTGRSWGDIAAIHGFAVVGGEALQFSSPNPPGPSPVPANCKACFADHGCSTGPSCVPCCKRYQGACAGICGDEKVPFRAAVAAVCGGVVNQTEGTAGTEATGTEPLEPWSSSATSGGNWHGGQWIIPEVQNDTTGLVCSDANPDWSYIKRAIELLEAHGGGATFDTSRVFFTGCSMGSAMTGWVAQCMHQLTPTAISAFATQSTGLKVKGDGLTFPPDNYATGGVTWGECAECKYFPAPVTATEGLKACVVDQSSDGFGGTVDFYKSSLALHKAWMSAGMRSNISISSGGHCATHSFEWIARCLDDGTGRLLTPLVER